MNDLIGPYLAHLRAGGRSPTTVHDAGRWLRYLDEHLPYGLEATTSELEDVLGTAGWKPATRTIYWCHTVNFYRWAVRSRRLDCDPSEELARPHRPRTLPRPVSDDQLRYALARLHHPWDLVVLLAAAAGMRRGEIARAMREDFDEATVIIRQGKGGRQRIVPLDPRIWVMVLPLPPGPVVAPYGHALTAEQLGHAMRHQFQRIGLTQMGVTLHRYRHWFGTTVQREHRDLRVTQELMGHASPATTAGYAAVTDRQRRVAIQTLSAAITGILERAA